MINLLLHLEEDAALEVELQSTKALLLFATQGQNP